MKKILLAMMISVSFIVSISAFSWEGIVDVNAAFTGPVDEISLRQTDRLTMSFKTPIKGSVPMSITGTGFYEFGYQKDLTTDADAVISNLLDVSLLKYNAKIGDIAIDAGRFSVADVTGLVIAQTLDAAKVTYSASKFNVSAYAGFTGFLNSHTVSMNIAPNLKFDSEIYAFAAPFVVANATLSTPRLFLNQDLFAEVLATIDVGAKENPDNRVYTNIALVGPLASSLYYSLTSSIAVIQNDSSKWNVSNLTSLEFTTFFPYGSSMLSWKTVFATNDFKSFSSTSASLTGSVPYSGCVKTGLVGTIRPIDKVLFFFAPDVLFNVMNDSLNKGYVGFQWMFNAKYTATSDLDIMATVGQFIPSVKDEKPYLNASVGLSFKF